MKLAIKLSILFLLLTVFINAESVNAGITAPAYFGRVTSQTGAPVSGATVTQSNNGGAETTVTGFDQNGNPTSFYNTPVPPASRTTTTGGDGRFSFGSKYPEFSCLTNLQYFSASIPNGNCSGRTDDPGNIDGRRDGIDMVCNVNPGPPPPPPPTPPPPACNVSCSSNEFCATTPDGCTSCIAGTCQKCEPKPAETRTLACPPGQTGSITETRTWACPAASWSEWTATSNTCTPPPACGDNCTSDSYCFGAPDGCTSCVPNNTGTGKVCSKPPVCGSSCVRDDQCIGDAAKNGCTACVSGVCRTPPVCGSACTTKAECSGAKDGCSECMEGTCTDYNQNMCKCDGLTAELDYPNNFKFEAFGKVEGADRAKAEIADITFRMTKDGGTVVAKSNPITPQIVENSDSKIRFKAAWQTAPPPVSPNSTYRVFADVRCKPKRIVSADAEKSTSPIAQTPEAETLPPPKGLVLLTDLINMAFGGNGEVKAFTGKVLAQMSSPSPAPQADTNLQLRTLNFVKLMDTNNCNFVRFKFDESLF